MDLRWGAEETTGMYGSVLGPRHRAEWNEIRAHFLGIAENGC